jgi:hypothetical protein
VYKNKIFFILRDKYIKNTETRNVTNKENMDSCIDPNTYRSNPRLICTYGIMYIVDKGKLSWAGFINSAVNEAIIPKLTTIKLIT